VSAQTPAAAERRTYGNWRRPRPKGLWRLGPIPTLAACSMIPLVGLTMMFFGLLAGLAVMAAVGGPIGALLIPNRTDGRTRAQNLTIKAAGTVARRNASNRYRSGPLGAVPSGGHALPGVLAASVLSEAVDPVGRRFAVLCHPHVRHLTVVLESEPEGRENIDQLQIDQKVAHYHEWLAKLTKTPGLVCAQVSVETAPDSGGRLRRMLDEHRAPSPPVFTAAVVGEIAKRYPVGAAEVKARIALTFQMADLADRRLTAQETVRQLAERLPDLTVGLQNTGAGAAMPVSARRLCQIIRVAYDPHAATDVELAASAGVEDGWCWEDVGPARAEALSDRYRHDGACAVTWEMSEAPRSAVQEQLLADLLAPRDEVPRKRVTILYRIVSPAAAARMVEQDVDRAELRVDLQKRPDARSRREVEAARAIAEEEAAGSHLISFGMLVTATALDDAGVPLARAAVENTAPAARNNLRLVRNSQDSAFAAALPLGVWLPHYLRVTETMREGM